MKKSPPYTIIQLRIIQPNQYTIPPQKWEINYLEKKSRFICFQKVTLRDNPVPNVILMTYYDEHQIFPNFILKQFIAYNVYY